MGSPRTAAKHEDPQRAQPQRTRARRSLLASQTEGGSEGREDESADHGSRLALRCRCRFAMGRRGRPAWIESTLRRHNVR